MCIYVYEEGREREKGGRRGREREGIEEGEEVEREHI